MVRMCSARLHGLGRITGVQRREHHLYPTNAGNLRVQLADVPDEDSLIMR